MANNEELKMEFTNLGTSGLKVSKVILGAMQFGSSKWQDWIIEEEEALPLLEHAYKIGIRTWDTADVYSNGRSEEIIGKAIKKYNIPRHKLVIMTKLYFGVSTDGTQPNITAQSRNAGETLNSVGLSRKHILDAVAGSTARLGTYIDVLQIHRLDRGTPTDEILRALHSVVEAGHARYLGASSMAAWEFQRLQNHADRRGYHRFVSMQNYHNLLYREEEREMLPFCEADGVGVVPWSPLARGALARPWAERGTHREKTDRFLARLVRERETEADRRVVERVEEVAKAKGVSMAGVATAWLVGRGECPIVGLGSKERMDEACENVKIQLSEEERRYLEEPYVPKPVMGY